MKIFEVQTKLTNYAYPLIKIVVSLLIIFFSVFRDEFFIISIGVLNFLLKLFCFIATSAAILCMYISVGELFYVWANKKKQKGK